MMHKTVTFQDLGISPEEVFRQMGYGVAWPDDRVADTTVDMLRRLDGLCSPRFSVVTAYASLSRHELQVSGVTLHVGRMIARQLAGSEAFAFFVATAGEEVESLQERLAASGDMLGAFIADAVGSVMAERCADLMETTLQQSVDKLGWRHTNRFSPGYCHWHVREQPLLFSVLGDATCGVTLNDLCLMSPVKSVSGVVGLGAGVSRKDYACAMCDMPGCQLRRR